MKLELVDKITSWEAQAGESFNDYFSDDSIKLSSWAFWLLGKGYDEIALELIDLILSDDPLIFLKNRDDNFEVYPNYVNDQFSEENYLKNFDILAEFLLASPYYTVMVENFFNLEENQLDSDD